MERGTYTSRVESQWHEVYEMGRSHLVHGRWGVPDTGVNKLRRLVEGSNGPSKPRFLITGNRGGDFCRIRIGFDAGTNARTIQHDRALVACSGLGDDCIARRLCRSVLESWANLAGVDCCRCANGIAGSELYFLPEY